jgi:iron complex outermembrane receptor protein
LKSGTTNGTITAADGTFSFNTNAQSGTIVISFIGYTSQTVSFDLGSSSDVGNISLELDAKNIDEVVVTGYGVIDVAKDRGDPRGCVHHQAT